MAPLRRDVSIQSHTRSTRVRWAQRSTGRPAARAVAWMVAGAKDVLATEDLGVTDEMKKDAESYRAESDIIGAFIEDRLVYDAGYDGDKLTQIRDAFAAWSEANGGEHLLRSPGALTRKLTERRYGGHKTELVRPRVGKERDRRLKGLRVVV